MCGFLNGFFGSGGGVAAVFFMEKFLKKDAQKAHASAILIILMITAASSFFYVSKGYFDFALWLKVSLGGVIGGIAGAKFLGKIPKHYLKIIFGGVILYTAHKMITR